MKIQIVHKGNRNQLICEKKDGTVERADLGPKLPYHDIAHFVVEHQLKFKNGFYGNIYNGYSVKQLSDKEIIRKLPAESTVSEITTRALQSLAAGACTVEQFTEIIHQEFTRYAINFPLALDEKTIRQMLWEYENLVAQWEQLKDDQGLELHFELEN
ncbi:MAG TPA: hypothetical protein VD905_17880 [Flavobacteriales bacterium]|nr:hypothetical protein [Flavobacteriales bacterium]